MDARKIVEDDIKCFVKKALYHGVLSNPKISGDFYSNRSTISSKYTRFADENDYLQNYYKKYESGEYFAVFPDGAFLQINYEFNIRSKNISHLNKLNLCYLPSVFENAIKNEYIRVDYSNDSSNSFFHPYAHMHVGFRNSIRIPIDEVMLLSEFCKMILYYYPDLFVVIFGETTNTKDTSQEGKLTNDIVLSKELQNYLHIKVV